MDLGWKVISTGVVFLILGLLVGIILLDDHDDERVEKIAGITTTAGLAIIIAGILIKIWM